jgi:hypothetical protein
MMYQILITAFISIFPGLQLHASQMSNAELAALKKTSERVAPPGGLVVESVNKPSKNAKKRHNRRKNHVHKSVNCKAKSPEEQEDVNRQLIEAISDRYTGVWPNTIKMENKAIVKSVQDAIHAGANVNYIGDDGFTPLMVAIIGADAVEVVDILIKAGANLNFQAHNVKETPLMHAVHNVSKIMVKRLLDAGADITLKNNEGKTALEQARNKANYVLALAKYNEKKYGEESAKSDYRNYAELTDIVKMLQQKTLMREQEEEKKLLVDNQ